MIVIKLLIIRHADPDYAKESLTEKGWHEAELLTDRLFRLSPDYIYSSPLGRARDTASLYLKKSGKTLEICDWLEEFWGYIIDRETEKERICWDLLPEDWTKEEAYFNKDEWYKTELMQSGNVEKRYREVCEGLDALLLKHGYRRDGNLYRVEQENTDTIALFCHFGVETVLLSHLLNISPVQLWHGFVALPSSVTVLNTEERRQKAAYFRCAHFGDVSHLYTANEHTAFAARFCEVFSSEDRH